MTEEYMSKKIEDWIWANVPMGGTFTVKELCAGAGITTNYPANRCSFLTRIKGVLVNLSLGKYQKVESSFWWPYQGKEERRKERKPKMLDCLANFFNPRG